MQIALAQRGTHVSLRTVYRTMSEAGLIHRHRRPHGITKADTATQDKENLIKRNFTADAPLKKLLTDITEVQCADASSMYPQFSTVSMAKLLLLKCAII